MTPHPRRSGPRVLVAAVLLPFFFSSYRVTQFTLVLAYAVAALGPEPAARLQRPDLARPRRVLRARRLRDRDPGGQVGLAAPAPRSRSPRLICAAAGFAVGIPALRLHGLYLALVTLGLAVAMPQLIKRFDGLTGGTQGLAAPPPAGPRLGELPRRRPVALPAEPGDRDPDVRARRGDRAGPRRPRAGRGPRQPDRRQDASASTSPRYKTSAFAISAAYAGVGGSMFAITVGFVAPESFGFALSASASSPRSSSAAWRRSAGAIFGALFIEFVPVYAADVNEALAAVIYGGVLIVFMYVLPTGVVGLLRRRAGPAASRRREACGGCRSWRCWRWRWRPGAGGAMRTAA